jgi:hypothetical protein
VVAVFGNGYIQATSPGTSQITAKVQGVNASGTTTVVVTYPTSPQTCAQPTSLGVNVIALLSAVYPPVPVDTWGAGWSNSMTGANLTEYVLGSAPTKKYTNLSYVGVEFWMNGTLDVSTMTHFRFNVWSPDMTALEVTLVDFGADQVYGGGDDSQSKLTLSAADTAGFTDHHWFTVDLPLSRFTGLQSTSHLAQLEFGDPTGGGTLYVEDVLFHD